jgi:uncharacterized surface protein with fasciclin (FAS1) repeats
MDMARLRIKLESMILIAVGLGAGIFTLFGEYRLLMNPRFLYLTAGGAAVILLIGVAALFSTQKRNNGFGLAVFGLFIALILFGRPYTPEKGASGNLFEPGSENPSAVMTDTDLPNMDMVNLYYAIKDGELPEGDFVTTGIVKRLPMLDRVGQFALMKTVMVCCLADALALGVRVSYDDVSDLKDGDWVNVYGRLKKTGAPVKTPSFRMGPVMFTAVNEQYVIEPEKVSAYDSTLKLKNTFDTLLNDRLSNFVNAVRLAGFEETLKEKGPYTVIAPINEAVEMLPEELFGLKNKDDLRDFVSKHIMKGRIMEKDMLELTSLTTIADDKIVINLKNGKVYIGNAKIIFGDNMARNGIVHMVYPDIHSE